MANSNKKSNRDQGGEFADLVGITITELEDGYACGEVEIKKKHTNKMGILHGGLIYSLADTVSGVAASSLGYEVVTLSSDFNYIKKGIDVKVLRAKGTMLKAGSTISLVEVLVMDQDDVVLSKGTFTFYNLKTPVES